MSKIRLSPYSLSHAPALYEAALESVAEVHPWLPWCHPGYQLAEAEEWLRMQEEHFRTGVEYEFAIESDDGAYLGGCGLNSINRDNRFANLGYWVRTSRTQRSVATTAVRLLSEWAFANTDLARLEIITAADNVRSQAVAEKAGALREGMLRKRLQIHGVMHDAVVYSITRN